uniref:Mitochondrial inner membrane protease subunit 2 n=1 Tax=Actinia tenebrosa TaxID=6105 RepID=A0A6P8I7B3_ACTTE
MSRVFGYVKAFSKGLVLSLPVYIALVDNIGNVATVHGASMKPCFNPDHRSLDVVMLSKIAIRNFQGINRGDVVSIVDPHDPNIVLIKRIIGLQGDTIKTLGYKNKYVKIPKGHCWVEGDNNAHSMDSNTFGPVAVGLIQAKATYILWPIHRWGKIHSMIPDSREPLTSEECEQMNKQKTDKTAIIEDSEEERISKDVNGLKFADYESMNDCSLIPGKFGPVS